MGKFPLDLKDWGMYNLDCLWLNKGVIVISVGMLIKSEPNLGKLYNRLLIWKLVITGRVMSNGKAVDC